MQISTDKTIEEVYNFWNESFLYSMELNCEAGSKEFFDAIHALKIDDIEKFSYHFWEFDKHPGKKVLDIGCGPGWLVRNYAQGDAEVYAVDIADVAVNLTNKMLECFNHKANIQKSSAESLPFEDNTFDLISSSGVLHHTPDMQKAVNEAYRVLKPGSTALISIYYKNALLNDAIFPLFLTFYRLIKPKVPGRDGLMYAKNVDDFIRMYDGEKNPVGYGLNLKDAEILFKNFEILDYEIHFFPKRFFPVLKNIPDSMHKLLDNHFGTMIYFKLRKPDE